MFFLLSNDRRRPSGMMNMWLNGEEWGLLFHLYQEESARRHSDFHDVLLLALVVLSIIVD